MFKRYQAKKKKSFLDQDHSSSIALAITDEDLKKQLQMISLNKQELNTLKNIQPLVEENIDVLVQQFYNTILHVSELRTIIEKHSSIERLEKTLKKHIIEMVGGTIDDAFLEKRYKVAQVHFTIGLTPKWYLAAFQNLQSSFIEIINEHVQTKEESKKIISAVTKILNFEQQLVLEAYEKENLNNQKQLYEKVREDLKSTVLATSMELVSLVQQTNESVETLVFNSKEVDEIVHSNNEKTNNTYLLAYEGKETMNQLSSQINGTMNHIKIVEEMVDNLGSSFEQIKGFIEIVENISKQTNLLSLNSSIEAARAGEYGKGFGVVAKEVRKLANETAESIKEIQTISETSNRFMEEVITSMENVQTVINQGTQSTVETEKSFDKILESSTDNMAASNEVNQQMKHLIEIIEDIGKITSKVTEYANALNTAANHA